MTIRQGKENAHRSRYLGSRAATGPNGCGKAQGRVSPRGGHHAMIGIFFTRANSPQRLLVFGLIHLCDVEDFPLNSRQTVNASNSMSSQSGSPEDMRRISKKLGLSQTATGQVIGGGPRAFQKYESGDLLPSRAISSALRLLDHDPKALRLLRPPQDKTAA